MTPTEKKYAKRLGKLYFNKFSRWDYSGDEAVFIKGCALVMVEKLERRYGDSGDYVYHLRPLEKSNDRWYYLNKHGYFREYASRWNDATYIEYKQGDPLNGEHLLKD